MNYKCLIFQPRKNITLPSIIVVYKIIRYCTILSIQIIWYNSVYSLWLCKECGGECVQDVSPLISNDVNTLVSEIFICEKIKRSMILYMDFQSQRVNKVHFPSPFNNRTILSYCSVMHVVNCALFSCFLILAYEFMHLKGCDLGENGILEVFF